MSSPELSQRIVTGSILSGLLLVLLLFAMTSPLGVKILMGVFVLCGLRIGWEVHLLRRTPELTIAVLFPLVSVLFEIGRVGVLAPLSILAGTALLLSAVTIGGYAMYRFVLARNSLSELSNTLAPDLLLIIFVGSPLSLILALLTAHATVPYLLWSIVIVIVTDTMAYFGGKFFQGPKLAPLISPKKTWSGLACGVAAATVIGACWGIVLLKPMGNTSFVVLAFLLALLAQAADLAKSYVKRLAGVKDTGQLLPGHGGLLDRVDGHLAAAALVALTLLTFPIAR